MTNLNLLKPGFSHRHDANGSHDSVCTRCYVTVATAQNESELASHESAHICDEWDLYRFSQGARMPLDAGSAFSV
jgi:hypothetical protein